MTLADLRRLAIEQHLHIRFRLSNGMECILSEHGIAQVPELKGAPGFQLEEELAAAGEFLLDPAGAAGKAGARPRHLSREELTTFLTASTARRASAHGDHEDE